MTSVLRKHWLLLRLALLAWMALILFLSSRSSLPGDSPPVAWMGQYQDEVGHLGEYGVLGMLAYLSLLPSLGRRGACVLSLVLGVAFSLGDEAFQSMIPNRTPQVTDLLLDAVGVTGGLVLLAVVGPGLKRYLRTPG
ncbi:MAG: VanZ family protein [Chloroflexi bacterium]|nr:VanZ family protein [Chloroflexota bacterium]